MKNKKCIILFLSLLALFFLFSPLVHSQESSTPLKKYKILINSKPKEAKIFVNGVERGKTPFKIELEEGTYRIRIEKQGYYPREEKIEVRSDLFRSFKLKKKEVSEKAEPPEKKEPEKKEPEKEERQAKAEKTPVSEDVAELSKVQQRPKPVKMAKVRAPRRAKKTKITGTIEVRVLISEEGDVLQVEIVKMISNPPAWLHDAVVKALLNWKFTPAVKDGKKVKVWLPFKLTI